MLKLKNFLQRRTTDGNALLIKRFHRVERRRKIKAVGLVAPLFLFLLVTFLIPILLLLYRAVENQEIREVMPRTVEAIRNWQGSEIPNEAVFAALATDLRRAQKDRSVGIAGKRLNYDITGFRSLLLKTAHKLSKMEENVGSYRDTVIGTDQRWADSSYWAAIKRAAKFYTDFYLLASVDLEHDQQGKIVRVSADRALYLRVLVRTFWMSFVVTLWCLALGYPVAWMLANLKVRNSNLLMILVLLPFWTSLLVRTSAWMLLLQKEGIINKILVWLHLVPHPIQLLFNRFGVYVAMIHILLPFMILPLYSVMKNIPPSYIRAATSLGANPVVVFLKVYLPQSMPGVSAGCLLVFILAIGYYITPALLGGPRDQMLSYFIAFFTNNIINWGMAAGLAVLLLTATIVLYILFNRFISIERLRMR